MNGEFIREGVEYLSSRKAQEVSGLSWDALMDLVDYGDVEARQVGHLSYIKKRSLLKYIKTTQSNSDVMVFHPAYALWLIPAVLILFMGLYIMFSSFAGSKAVLSMNLSSVIAPFTSVVNQKAETDGSYTIGKSIGGGMANIFFSYADMGSKIGEVLSDGAQEDMSAQVPNITTSSDSDNGVVLVPTQGIETDAKVISNIKNSFSDEVSVIPNYDGVSGVIRPIFKEGPGKDFIYVIVPVD